MSMPEIIRQYLRTFELRKEIENMRSITSLRKLPHWLPLRNKLLRRNARKTLLRSAAAAAAVSASAAKADDSAEALYASSDQRRNS
jgi:hypothetical protein